MPYSQQKFLTPASLSAKTLEHVVERSREAFILLSSEWRFLYANEQARKILGRSQPELAGQNIWDLFPDLSGTPFYDSAHMAMQQDVEVELGSDLESAGGPVLYRFFPSPEGLLVALPERMYWQHAVEVTDNGAIKEAFYAHEERYAKLFHMNPAPFSLSHMDDGRIVEVNDAFLRLFEYTREEVIGRTSLELQMFADVEDRMRAVGGIRKQGFVRDMELQVRTGTGEIRDVFLSAERLELEGRQALLTVLVDVTERRRMVEALRIQEEHYRRALEDSGLVAARVDRDLRYVWIHNPHPDFEPSQVIGKRDDELLPPAEAAEIVALKQDVLHMGERIRRVLVFDRSDGRHYYDMTGVPLRNAEGHVSGLTTVSFDISKQKLLEHELETMNSMLEERVEQRTKQVRELVSALTLAEHEERQRVAIILHDDFQQHLYGMQLQLYMLKLEAQGTGMEDRIGQANDLIVEAIETARNLMVELSPPVLKGEGLGKALQWLGSQMQKRFGLHVDVQEQENLPIPTEGMRVLLFQTVRELLTNVVRHARTDRAWVSLYTRGADLVIEVVSRGAEFDQEVLQADRIPPKGFDLLAAQERLKLFDGRAQIDSRPEVGTCVTLLVPIRNL